MARKILSVIHRLVAKDLLDKIQWQRNNYCDLLDQFIRLNSELQELKSTNKNQQNELRNLKQRQRVENNDGAIAVQVIKERMREGQLQPNVVSSGLHAAKIRNEELIRENERLQRLLRTLQQNG